jgi:cytoskeletal protein RodZ
MLSESEQNAASATDADIGSALRDARTIAGISLDDVSRRTRISKSFLEFIELNQFDKLPGVGYIPGFIRNYCTAISVDPTPYIETFKDSLNVTDARPEYKFHVQALVPKMAGSVVAMIAVAAALSGYIGWTIIGSNQSDEPINVAQSTLAPADDVLEKLSEQEGSSDTVSPLSDRTITPLARELENASEASLETQQQTDSAVSQAMPIQSEEEIAEAPTVIS